MIGDLVSVLFMSKRSIGGIIPDVTIEEHHTDSVTITDHPVEQGAKITDHAYVNPAELTMRVGWNNASLLVNSVVSGSIFSGKISDVTDLYGQMLSLQASREPFDVVTGKRTYSNMLIKSISMTTDKDTENCLILEVGMRQIIIVETSTTSLAADDSQAEPQDTGAVVRAGTVQPQTLPPAKQSALSVLWGG